MKAYFSNRIEQLYAYFRQELYTSNPHPFGNRIVVVPSPAIKNWLLLQMADDSAFNISMGLKISYLEKTLQELCVTKDGYQPSEMALSFALEQQLRKKWSDGTLDRKINSYLGPCGNAKGTNRLILLSNSLAALFKQYGIYGGEMVQDWEKNPTRNWQAELWATLFSGNWTYPAKLYQQALASAPKQTSIHLFSCSYLPRIHHLLLQQLAETVPVRYYILSPCQRFWSDILSDREAGYLQSYWKKKGAQQEQLQELEEYLTDRNPLLANYGGLGRAMARIMEEGQIEYEASYGYARSIQEPYSSYLSEEFYFDSERQSGNLSLLQALQADLGLMRHPLEELDAQFSEGDDSVQVHSVTDLVREVEVVRDIILRAIDKKGVKPESIIVMAPEITHYTSIIKTLFEESSCPLDYQLLDIGTKIQVNSIQALEKMFALMDSRWDALKINDLLPFIKGFSAEDCERITRWLVETGIQWGYDIKDREELIHHDHDGARLVASNEQGTWKEGFARLVRGLVLEPQHDLDPIFPYVSSVDGDLIETFLQFFSGIRRDLFRLKNGTKTVSEWLVDVEYLISNYLKLEKEAEEYCDRMIRELRVSAKAIDAQKVSFQSVKMRLIELLNRKEGTYRESYINSVRFCSMLPMRAIPADLIIMMGMSEGVYPKQEVKTGLDMMRFQDNKCEKKPSQTDYDRFLFLEGVLSARKSFAITYSSVSRENGKDLPPSIIVAELIDYLKKSYGFELNVKAHPSTPFDPIYFSGDPESAFISYSQRDYQLAKKVSHSSKKDPSINQHRNEAIFFMDAVSFIKAVQNPLRHYLREELKIAVRGDAESLQEESFQLSPLKNYALSKVGIFHDSEEVLTLIAHSGKLPTGLFGEASMHDLKHELEQIGESKKAFGLEGGDFFTISFSSDVSKPEKEGQGWVVPPVPVGNKLLITGSISECTEKGIWQHSGFGVKEAFKAMTRYLIFSKAIEHFALPIEKNILFGKEGVKKGSLSLSVDNHLLKITEMLSSARYQPTFMPIDWVELILKADAVALQKKIDSTIEESYDPYLKWYITHRQVPDAESIIESYREQVFEIYGEVYHEWLEMERVDATI